ncbi:unnamed protein product [Lupinus luteus]|uniref:Uncharacterized protein n=1 Tax=Lupinus luteus TaxID=3873 RepID=A0AAV1WMT5_LUPLU
MMKVLFLCALLLSMTMLNQGVMGNNINVKSESCKKNGHEIPGCNEKKPRIKANPYRRGCSYITRCRRDD